MTPIDTTNKGEHTQSAAVITLRVEPAGVTVPLMAGETILAGLFRNGYAYRVGCRRGGCGICKVNLVAGEVTYAATISEVVFSQAEESAGLCLSCRAVPTTDAVIWLREDDRLRCVIPMFSALAAGRAHSEEGES